jgi:hypothetical protein
MGGIFYNYKQTPLLVFLIKADSSSKEKKMRVQRFCSFLFILHLFLKLLVETWFKKVEVRIIKGRFTPKTYLG